MIYEILYAAAWTGLGASIGGFLLILVINLLELIEKWRRENG